MLYYIGWTHFAGNASYPKLIVNFNFDPQISAMKCGLLPVSQEALICGKISYHDYQGVLTEPEERDKLARNLGVHNKVSLVLCHHITKHSH